jgi:hypothetical protein
MFEEISAEFLINGLSKKICHPLTVYNPIIFAISLYRKNIPVELREIILIYFGKEIGFFERKLYAFCLKTNRQIQKAVLQSKNQKEFELQLKKEKLLVYTIKRDRLRFTLHKKIVLSLSMFQTLLEQKCYNQQISTNSSNSRL